MSLNFNIFPRKFLFALGLWIPASIALWTYMGYSQSFFFLACWTFLFSLMIVEDFFYQTVDVRLAAILLAMTGIYSYFENNLEMFGWGCIAGLYISFLVFVLGIRSDEAQGDEKACESTNMQELSAMQMGFVPSIGLAIALWFFAGKYVMNWLEIIFAVESIFRWQSVEGIVVFSLLIVAVCAYQYKRIGKKRWREKKITVGFGEGDIFVCLIIGGFLGWQGFLFVFVAALCVHIVIAVAIFLIEKLKIVLPRIFQ